MALFSASSRGSEEGSMVHSSGLLRLLAVPVLALALFTGPTAEAKADPNVVHTTAGDVQGLVDGSSREWRGIPYAAPPVGPLRWKPPAGPTSWTGVRPATGFSSDCIQLGDTNDTTEGSEDCL